MSTLPLHSARCVATLDEARAELRDASVFIRGHLIEIAGPSAELPAQLRNEAQETIDARRHLVTPGLVNTHHPMFQSPTAAWRRWLWHRVHPSA